MKQARGLSPGAELIEASDGGAGKYLEEGARDARGTTTCGKPVLDVQKRRVA